MALIKTPAVIQPAYNELLFVDNTAEQLSVHSAGVAYPHDKQYTFSRVPEVIDGQVARAFDVSGVVKTFFTDLRVEHIRFLYHDYNLKAEYVGPDGLNRLALNAVKQQGSSVDLYADTSVGALRTYAEKTGERTYEIPVYDGYPVGATIMAKREYETEADVADAFRFTMTARDENAALVISATFGGELVDVATGRVSIVPPGLEFEYPMANGDTTQFAFIPVIDSAITISNRRSTYIVSVDHWAGQDNGVLQVGRYNLGVLDRLTQIADKIGPGLYAANNLFTGAIVLTNIPANLFQANTGLGDFRGTFKDTSMLSDYPNELFANIRATSYEECFMGSGITIARSESLPLSNAASERALYSVFEGCVSLSEVQSLVFAQASGIRAVNPRRTFAFSRIDTLSADVFAGITAINHFEDTFMGAELRGGIPEQLFSSHPEAILFTGTFNQAGKYTGATPLTIPAGLFAGNPNITDFIRVFAEANITSIPNTLFDNTLKIERFTAAFSSIGTQLTGSTPRRDGVALWQRGRSTDPGEYSAMYSDGLVTPVQGVSDDGSVVSVYWPSGSNTTSGAFSVFTRNQDGTWPVDGQVLWTWPNNATMALSPDGTKAILRNTNALVLATRPNTTSAFSVSGNLSGGIYSIAVTPDFGRYVTSNYSVQEIKTGSIDWVNLALSVEGSVNVTSPNRAQGVIVPKTFDGEVFGIYCPATAPIHTDIVRTPTYIMGSSSYSSMLGLPFWAEFLYFAYSAPTLSYVAVTASEVLVRLQPEQNTYEEQILQVAAQGTFVKAAVSADGKVLVVVRRESTTSVRVLKYTRTDNMSLFSETPAQMNVVPTRLTSVSELVNLVVSANGAYASLAMRGVNGSTTLTEIGVIKLPNIAVDYPANITGQGCFLFDTALSDYAQIPSNWK